MKRRIWLSIIASLLLFASDLRAQKSPEDLLEEINRLPASDRQRRLEDGAKKEREVVWYSTMNREDSNELIRAFETNYPYVKVNFVTAGGPKTLNRITAEYRAGAYLYDAKNNNLKLVQQSDVRAHTGREMQPFVKEAPLNLVFVANLSKMATGQKMVLSDEEKTVLAAIAAGAIVQNVYLFCASEGLSAVVRALIDKEALSKDLHLNPDQKIIVAQTVGYPKK